MDASLALPETENLARALSTEEQSTLALARDEFRDPNPESQQNSEHVQHALNNLKRAEALTGSSLKEADLRIGRNVIIIDDRFLRR